MSSIIKQRLKELCDQNPSLNILWAQWSFDEQLISKALNNVNQIFPHYSRHDASHSNQILTNIERILGKENINSLSATDLWLLLESAFYHDIGMVIPISKIRDDWDTPEFRKFINSVSTDKKHELNKLGVKYINSKLQLIINNSQWPLDVFEEIRLLLSDFYRNKHASRSEDIINNPWQEIGLSSPRNELLPTRLFKILGSISAHHGYTFNQVMQLPKNEVGIANDDAHPRYIACLLRVGDLLDLDNNRFCPVMLKTAGAIPESTQAHIEKHMAISHFRMDQNRIEVQAVCETYSGYEATSNWFSYLQDEFNNQMRYWDDIVPHKNMGLLPTIGKLDIQLKDYELLKGGGTPKFEVDEDKMFGLLKGSGLYKYPNQCIREVLQNSADATLVKLWCDKHLSLKYEEIDFDSPSERINKLIKEQYGIEVTISKSKVSETNIDWNIIIKDRGIGIDKKGLSFLQKIGSSNKDERKKELMDSMPLWLKPSGAFGIGFQSIFLITDQVRLTSKSYFGSELLTINMDAPNESNPGNIFIKQLEESFKVETGTILEFKISTKRIPDKFSYNYDETQVLTEISSFDFIDSDELNVEILQLIHRITEFSTNSFIPVSLLFDDKKIETPSFKFNEAQYIKDEGIQITVKAFGTSGYRSDLLFKGQKVETKLTTSFIVFEINILSKNANDILEINRNKIKSDILPELNEYLYLVLINYLHEHRDSFQLDQIPFIDSFIIASHNYNAYISRDFKFKVDPNLLFPSTDITTTDVIDKPKVKLKIRDFSSFELGHSKADETQIDSDNNELVLIIDRFHHCEVTSLLLKYLLPRYFPGVLFEGSSVNEGQYKETVITYSKEPSCKVDKSILKQILASRQDKNNDRWPRAVFFCEDNFLALAVRREKIGFSEWLTNDITHLADFPQLNVMVLPFRTGNASFSPFNLDKLIEWTYENRLASQVTIEEIKIAYEKYIGYVTEIFNEVQH